MRPSARMLAVLAALLLPGCLLDLSEDGGAGASTAAEAGGAASASPQTRVLYLDADGTMRPVPPATESVAPVRWSWFQWWDGTPAPAWHAPEADAAYVVTKATATVVHTAMHPVTSPQQRPEFTVWFGVEARIAHHGFHEGPDVLLPSDAVVAAYELGLPRGGLVVEQGERLALHIGSYYNDDARQGGVATVFGGSEPTRLEIEVVPLAAAPAPLESVTYAFDDVASLSGGRCMGFDPLSPSDIVWIPVPVDLQEGTLIGLDLGVTHQGGTGPPDIDFVLVDDAGEVVAEGAGSAGAEAAHLRGPNLAGASGEWRLGVYACTLQQARVAFNVAMRYAP